METITDRKLLESYITGCGLRKLFHGELPKFLLLVIGKSLRG